MGGTSMKQGWAALKGSNRQEGEKPWRRTVPGWGKPRVNVDLLCCERRRGGNLM